MTLPRRTILLLATCQALLMTNNATVIALNGLVGYRLAPVKSLATLPVTGWVVGAAVTTFFASLFMRRFGRRAGFATGAAVGILGALVCSLAIALESFWLFCAGTVVFGVYNAFGQYYRFAAADVAAPGARSRAISYVLAGGLVGGLLGPNISKLTKDLLPITYLGAYLSLVVFMLAALFVLRFLAIPRPKEVETHGPARPLAAIAMQPAYAVAVLAAAFGYGVMNLLMTATPLAMGICGHPYDAAATVIASHVVGMFAPSFFTGSLIARFGVLQVMLAGVALETLCVMIALAGVDVVNFWAALVLLGVGWNFLYIGATTLITETYRPAEKARAQGLNDMLIFLTMAVSSFASGMILEQNGWQALNRVSLPFVLAVGIALLWLAKRQRRPQPA